MVESKAAAGDKVGIPSPSRKADATLRISPRTRGKRRYTIRYSLEDGGAGFDTRLTVFYRTEGGGEGRHQVVNRGPGTDVDVFVIRSAKKIVSMGAKVERIHSAGVGVRGWDPNVFS
ncbi:hypothetical protein [Nonomuraea typhae]|uniref:PLAT domain-containing protein n=1 Tax=Nonomuraea typhae TaxID=2603600 RepID=A0ABW7YTN0_9ACTN